MHTIDVAALIAQMHEKAQGSTDAPFWRQAAASLQFYSSKSFQYQDEIRTLCIRVKDLERIAQMREETVESCLSRMQTAEAGNATLRADAKRWREALVDTLAHLVAAHSLLERGGKKAAASDKMFAQMLLDYAASIARGRAAIDAAPAKEKTCP
jgi:hypothetical protein